MTDKGYKMASGCTLFPSKKIPRPDLSYLLKKESAKGILLSGTGEHVKQSTEKLEVRLDKPLGDALNSIFSHHGNVIFTFPGASDLQMREYLRTLEYEASKGTRKDDKIESEILPHHGVQDIKGQRTGSTQAKEISTAAAEDSIKCLNEVSEAVLPYFNAEATKLIKDRGAVEVVSAALAYISGVTTRVKLISSQHNAQFTTAGKEIGAQQMKTHVKKFGQVTARQQREQSEPEIMPDEEVPPHTHSDENFSLQLVNVLLEPVSACVSLIRSILRNRHSGANENDVVAVVLYPAESEVEVLTVNLNDDYKVYFMHFNPDEREIEDTSLFIRVAFSNNSSQPSKTLWINYNTLLPITCERGMNNRLRAKIPHGQDNCFAQQPSLCWLDHILANPAIFSDTTLFRESGEIDETVLTLDNSPADGRVSKESSTRNANAVIRNHDSNMAFAVETVYQ